MISVLKLIGNLPLNIEELIHELSQMMNTNISYTQIIPGEMFNLSDALTFDMLERAGIGTETFGRLVGNDDFIRFSKVYLTGSTPIVNHQDAINSLRSYTPSATNMSQRDCMHYLQTVTQMQMPEKSLETLAQALTEAINKCKIFWKPRF